MCTFCFDFDNEEKNIDLNIRVFPRMQHMGQYLLTLSKHLRSPPVFGGVRFAESFVFYVVFWGPIVCWFFFNLGVVSLLSTYKFECPSDIFRLFALYSSIRHLRQIVNTTICCFSVSSILVFRFSICLFDLIDTNCSNWSTSYLFHSRIIWFSF